MSRVLEWHMPENVVDHMNDVLVHEILFHEKIIRGRATGMHVSCEVVPAWLQDHCVGHVGPDRAE
jgi:hypothetical protein